MVRGPAHTSVQPLSGMVTIGESAPLVVQQHGVLIADGLVYADRIIDAEEGAVIDIKGE